MININEETKLTEELQNTTDVDKIQKLERNLRIIKIKKSVFKILDETIKSFEHKVKQTIIYNQDYISIYIKGELENLNRDKFINNLKSLNGDIFYGETTEYKGGLMKLSIPIKFIDSDYDTSHWTHSINKNKAI
jgi:hypothetical protein